MKGYKRKSEQSNLGSEFDRHDIHACYWRIGPRYPKSIASTSFVLGHCDLWPSRTSCVITYSCSILARNYEARNILYIGARVLPACIYLVSTCILYFHARNRTMPLDLDRTSNNNDNQRRECMPSKYVQEKLIGFEN